MHKTTVESYEIGRKSDHSAEPSHQVVSTTAISGMREPPHSHLFLSTEGSTSTYAPTGSNPSQRNLGYKTLRCGLNEGRSTTYPTWLQVKSEASTACYPYVHILFNVIIYLRDLDCLFRSGSLSHFCSNPACHTTVSFPQEYC